jgi:competence protein ComFB
MKGSPKRDERPVREARARRASRPKGESMNLSDRNLTDTLINDAEALVIQEMERQIPRHHGLCTCNECIIDIAAYALNNVRPRYRVSLLDTVFADRGEQSAYAREIERAVAEAIATVRRNPSHD